ncbi:MAG: hypothetical protein HY692_06300, partial [Cyanobacteria bacterium NC_groundwater_1444_Ag_S-0.65um_54_12]|nr:hypothetical protein [Cyanobacteria bacterium NC_groundwater_1444_Ag_S-0.65um_54_12]
YETGQIGRFVLEVDENGRASPEFARLLGRELAVDAIMVGVVSLFQQFMDHFPDRRPGESPTTLVTAEVHLIATHSGAALWATSKTRRDRGFLGGFTAFTDTARSLANELADALPK